jgi:hypothetical protein
MREKIKADEQGLGDRSWIFWSKSWVN